MTFAVGTGVGIVTGVMSGIAVVSTVAVGADVGSGVVVAVGSGVAAPVPKVGSNVAMGDSRNGVGVGSNVGVAVTFGARVGVGCEAFESPTKKTRVRFG
jgi:hypothetical protein